MDSFIVVNKTFSETRVAVLENNSVAEIYIERRSQPRMVGNIYKGRVGRIIPGMQAAFVDIGQDKSGFISVEDVMEEPFWEFLDGEEKEEAPAAETSTRVHHLIQDMLREGQDILVQVIKEPTGGKGPKLSSNIAIPGKYLVLLPLSDMTGVSRKITDKDERERLARIVREAKPPAMGFIVRTASEGVGEDELHQEMGYLLKLWNRIKAKSERTSAPGLVYEEPKLSIRAVRDFASSEVKKIIVDSRQVYEEIRDYMRERFGNHETAIEFYDEPTPIFKRYGVEEEIGRLTDKKVWLKSGGYLIIDLAEALTVIDVNTGKYLRGYEQEDTVYDINREAAVEIVRQIRLRNLVGIIVIDFIDMKDTARRREVFNIFTNALKRDRARSVVLEMSPFCVVQMTRQRIRENLLSVIAESCPTCHGTGLVKSKETTAYEIARAVMESSRHGTARTLTVEAHKEVLDTLQRLEGNNLKRLCEEHDLELKMVPVRGHPYGYYSVKSH